MSAGLRLGRVFVSGILRAYEGCLPCPGTMLLGATTGTDPHLPSDSETHTFPFNFFFAWPDCCLPTVHPCVPLPPVLSCPANSAPFIAFKTEASGDMGASSVDDDRQARSKALSTGAYVFYHDATAGAIGIQTPAPGADGFKTMADCLLACDFENSVSHERWVFEGCSLTRCRGLKGFSTQNPKPQDYASDCAGRLELCRRGSRGPVACLLVGGCTDALSGHSTASDPPSCSA